jgi:hypothetical protein
MQFFIQMVDKIYACCHPVYLWMMVVLYCSNNTRLTPNGGAYHEKVNCVTELKPIRQMQVEFVCHLCKSRYSSQDIF